MNQLSGTSHPPKARHRRPLLRFKFENGVLYRHIYHPDSQRWVPVLPHFLRLDVLKAFHDDVAAGHLGIQKTHDSGSLLLARYFY